MAESSNFARINNLKKRKKPTPHHSLSQRRQKGIGQKRGSLFAPKKKQKSAKSFYVWHDYKPGSKFGVEGQQTAYEYRTLPTGHIAFREKWKRGKSELLVLKLSKLPDLAAVD